MEYLKLPTECSSSPGTNTILDGDAHYVSSSGNVFSFDLHDSYGKSPNSGSLKEYDEICMNPDGFAIYCNITLSYGKKSPGTFYSNSAWYVRSDGVVDYNGYYYVSNSYGINRQNK